MHPMFVRVFIFFMCLSIYSFSSDQLTELTKELQESIEAKNFEKGYQIHLNLIKESAKEGLIPEDVSENLPKNHKDCPGMMYFAEACSILHKGVKQMQDSLNQMVSQGFMNNEVAEHLKNFTIENLFNSWEDSE